MSYQLHPDGVEETGIQVLEHMKFREEDGDVVVAVKVISRAPASIDGEYDGVDNTDPSNSGLIAHQRNASLDDTHQTERITSVTNAAGDAKSLDVSLHDEDGEAYSNSNPVPVRGTNTQGAAAGTATNVVGGRDIFTGAAYHLGLNHIGANIAFLTTNVFDAEGNILKLNTQGAVKTTTSRRINFAIPAVLSGVVFNATTTHSSSSITMTNYSRAMVYFNITTSAGSPTNVTFTIEQSPDSGVTWYALIGWSQTYTNAQTPVLESVAVDVPLGRLIRVTGNSTGTDASNTFTATVYLEELTNG